jgi:hypothetical protein
MARTSGCPEPLVNREDDVELAGPSGDTGEHRCSLPLNPPLGQFHRLVRGDLAPGEASEALGDSRIELVRM